jgi:hypothetical protein
LLPDTSFNHLLVGFIGRGLYGLENNQIPLFALPGNVIPLPFNRLIQYIKSMPRKRPALFEVRYSEKPNRDNHWRIVGFVNGKRTQFWFKTEEDAKTAAADKNAEITAYGTQIALSMRLTVWLLSAKRLTTP